MRSWEQATFFLTNAAVRHIKYEDLFRIGGG